MKVLFAVSLIRVALFFYAPLRALSQPFIFWILPLFVPFLRRRRAFEMANASDPFSRRHPGVGVEACFHVSSEGEFEQIASLALRLMERGKNIEILYTSPSVEKGIEHFCRSAKGRAFSLRLPLVVGGLADWVQARTLVMVRYDFFPDLLLLVVRKRSILVHATLKNTGTPALVGAIGGLFDFIVPAGPDDEGQWRRRGFGPVLLPWSDFRVARIGGRLEGAGEKLAGNPAAASLRDIALSYSLAKRIILGSFWQEDGPVLHDPRLIGSIVRSEVFLTVVAHRSDGDSLDRMYAYLLSVFAPHCPVYRTDSPGWYRQVRGRPGAVLFCAKGFLLELYSLFGVAFVGGGYGKTGVHSLLEPFMAGARVFCGPHTSRSTEYSLIRSIDAGAVVRLDDPGAFYGLASRAFDAGPSVGDNTSMGDRYAMVVRELGRRAGMEL